MATKLYLHDAASSDFGGTLPSDEQATAFPAARATGYDTIRTADAYIGSAQASLTVATSGTTNPQSDVIGMFCSLPLNGAQTVGGGSMVFNLASNESNTQANAWINAVNIYVWRPSNGTKVGTVKDSSAASLGSSEKTAAAEYSIYITGISTSAVSAQDGDVIMIEIWAYFTQGMTSSYNLIAYYDGATETNSDGTSVSDHASYIQLNETLSFKDATTTTTTYGPTTTTTTYGPTTTTTTYGPTTTTTTYGPTTTTTTTYGPTTTTTTYGPTTTTTTYGPTTTTTTYGPTTTTTTYGPTTTTTNALVNRFFAYNTGSTITNTDQVGAMAISTNSTDFIGSSSQVIWWAGPSEQVGYVIAYPVPTRNHPTQWGNIAEVGFKRSASLTTQSLLDLINYMRREQSLSEFATLTEGLAWLDTIPYWYSYGK